MSARDTNYAPSFEECKRGITTHQMVSSNPFLDHMQGAPESMKELFSMIGMPSHSHFSILICSGQKQTLKPGEVFVTEGNLGKHVYLLVSGSVSVLGTLRHSLNSISAEP